MQKEPISDDKEKKTRIAKLFRNGKNQAVRLPKEFEIQAEEVIIQKKGNNLILIPKPSTWDNYFSSATRLQDEFPEDIDDLPLETREKL